MKKMNRFSIAGLLAAGAMLFATLGCDTAVSEKEWADESPTTAKSFALTSVYDGAIWNFSTVKTDGKIGTTTISADETMITGEISPSTAGNDGTKLVATNFKGKAGNKTGIVLGSTKFDSDWLQSSAATASLSALDKGYSLTLTLATTSDIYLLGAGSGSADAKRYIAIYKDNTPCVFKDNLQSDKAVEFQIQSAPAGDYTIYINGACIIKLDLSKEHTFTAPASVASVAYDSTDLTKSATYITDTNPEGYYKELKIFESFTPKLNGTDTAGATENVTSAATWAVQSGDERVVSIVSGKVTAKYAGTAVVRGRVGRYLADYAVVATGSAKFALDSVEESKKNFEAVTGSLSLKAKTVDNSTDISEMVTWTSSDNEVATVSSSGKVVGVKAGTATITATIKDGAGTEFKDSIDVTITACNKVIATIFDTESEDFPKASTILNLSQQNTLDELVKNTTSVANAGSTGLTSDCFSVAPPTVLSTWVISKVYSNLGAADYPGIVYEPTTSATGTKIAADSSLFAITVTVTPPEGKTVSLTGVSAAIRTNAAKHKLVVKSGDTTLATSDATKDNRKFTATFDSPVEINKKTSVTFYVNVSENKAEKKLSIGDIKLYFATAE